METKTEKVGVGMSAEEEEEGCSWRYCDMDHYSLASVGSPQCKPTGMTFNLSLSLKVQCE